MSYHHICWCVEHVQNFFSLLVRNSQPGLYCVCIINRVRRTQRANNVTCMFFFKENSLLEMWQRMRELEMMTIDLLNRKFFNTSTFLYVCMCNSIEWTPQYSSSLDTWLHMPHGFLGFSIFWGLISFVNYWQIGATWLPKSLKFLRSDFLSQLINSRAHFQLASTWGWLCCFQLALKHNGIYSILMCFYFPWFLAINIAVSGSVETVGFLDQSSVLISRLLPELHVQEPCIQLLW